MGDAYWNRQAPMHQPAGLVKRPRSDYDITPPTMPVAPDMHNYFARDDDRGMTRIKDTQTIGSAYDRYLQSSHVSSFSSGETSNYKGVGVGAGVGLGRVGGGDVMPGLAARDPVATARGAVAPELVTNGRGMGYVGRLPVDAIARPRETLPLPPDASSTLYVEGLPPDSTKREVAHIFRPFVGYKEVRLVRKESKHRGGDPLVLCFVDFVDAACAATALSALQGYKMDEHDPDSPYLRLQFSKYPGARSGGSGNRGKQR
nr:RNA-binding protein 2-like [Ipomoea trifida]